MYDLIINNNANILAWDLVGDNRGMVFAEKVKLEAIEFPCLAATNGNGASKKWRGIGGAEYFDCGVIGAQSH